MAVALLACGVVFSLVSCSSDKSADVAQTSTASSEAAAVDVSVDSESTATSKAGETTVAEAASTTPPAGAGSHQCPHAAAVAAAVGAEMVVDTEAPAADEFCPYTVADGTDELFLSLTFTPLRITDAPASATPEKVSGLGQVALWSGEFGELTVWTGDTGLIVNLNTAGSRFASLDQKAASVALAHLALGI